VRTSEQEQKPTQQARAAGSPTHGRPCFSQSQAVHPILHLQRAIGNQAVQRMLEAGGKKLEADSANNAQTDVAHDFSQPSILSASPLRVQLKPAVTSPEDMSEQEADRVADHVMHMPEPQPQRACACGGGGCSGCGQKQGGHEQLQARRVRANDAGEMSMPPLDHEMVSSPGQPLETTTRGFMESRFGQDFSRVRVHTGPGAEDAANSVQARAFTLGQDIVFGPGQYAPHETRGQRLLAHELTHVIQQRPGVGSTAAHLSVAPKVSQRASAQVVQRDKPPAAPNAEDPAFWEWWKRIVGFEGDFESWKKNPGNKNDRGGQTNFGITKTFYMLRAKSVGLPATDEGFAAMTPDQAVLFGRMMWKSSGAGKLKNTGVALVLADWYWGGVDLGRFSAMLKAKGRAATFNQGKPDDATIAFMNTLPPADLVDLMSDAKAAQYRAIVKKDPTQKDFLEGWLNRNEERRAQAQPFVVETTPALVERGQNALALARDVLQRKETASYEEKKAARDAVWKAITRIETKQKAGFDNTEEEVGIKALKGKLLEAVSKLMDAGN
jgi:lysozyme family protein